MASLLHLPDDPLAHIAARLRHCDRIALAASHPSLAATLTDTNATLWRDLRRLRYPQLVIPPFLSDRAAVRWADTASDFLIHHSIQQTPLHTIPPSSHSVTISPCVALCDNLVHIAHATTYSVFAPASPHIVNHVSGSAGALDGDATALSVTPHTVAVGHSNGLVSVRVTAPRGVTPWKRVRGHAGRVCTVQLLGDEAVASGGADRSLRVRRLSRHGPAAVLRGHDGPVTWLANVSNGQVASHGGRDGRVKLWDVNHASCLSTARLGKQVTAAVAGDGMVYVAMDSAVHVLDARVGFACTVGVLSLPPRWSGERIGALWLGTDGALAGAVGGGGVAVWPARGRLEGRGLGWPRRWDGDPARTLRAVCVDGRRVTAGGGASEVLVFDLDGSYEGVMAEDGIRRGAVESVHGWMDGLVVGRAGGRVDFVDVRTGKPDWEAVQRVVDGEGEKPGFWDADVVPAFYDASHTPSKTLRMGPAR